MTLGNAAEARVRFIVWCLDCRHQAEPDPAEMAERHGAEMVLLCLRIIGIQVNRVSNCSCYDTLQRKQ